MQHPAHFDDVAVRSHRVVRIGHCVAIADRGDVGNVLKEEAAAEIDFIVFCRNRIQRAAWILGVGHLNVAAIEVIPCGIAGPAAIRHRVAERLVLGVLTKRQFHFAKRFQIGQCGKESSLSSD
ncbi:hypothetical protein SDC9_155865 [bioreactor metagenome]|uniref:Uncharacterized protein n=1 Tax=bioreactor metagenome TaxID=1076179 RepID=A0A645F4Z4_9ZZZZ